MLFDVVSVPTSGANKGKIVPVFDYHVMATYEEVEV
jgi:hypothetical protein